MSRWSKDAKTHVEYACLDDNKIYLAKHITAIFGNKCAKHITATFAS